MKWLAICAVSVRQAAEYHFYKNIRGYVSTTPFGVEVFSRCCGHCFVYCLSCCNQIHDALPNLHQHIAVVLQIGTSGYGAMARYDLCLVVSLRQNLIDGMNHTID